MDVPRSPVSPCPRRRARHSRRLLATATAAGALAALASPLAGSAWAGVPSQTGCPVAFQRLSVSALVELGYQMPPEIDAAGNSNGYLCGKPISDAAYRQTCRVVFGGTCPVPVIYLYLDDTLTPAH